MKIGSVLQLLNLFRGPSKLCCDQCSIFRYPVGMSAGVFIFCLNGRGKCLHHLQGHFFCLFLLFFQFLLLACFFHIFYISNGSEYADKEKNQHANTNKDTGQVCDKIYRSRFYGNTEHSNQQTQKQKMICLILTCVGIQAKMYKYY